MTENYTSIFLALGLIVLPALSMAQDQLVVERCDAIDQSSPIHNIWVDQDGQKWIANDDGLYIVHACDLATPAELKSGESSLLQIPDGNAVLSWTNEELTRAVGNLMYDGDVFSTAHYRQQSDELWLGTQESGLFLLKTKPSLRLQEYFNTDNSKLKSDYIHSIAFDESGRQFIGTEDGVLVGRNHRWSLEERYFRFQAMAVEGRKMWLLSEDMIWIVDERDNFEAAPIDPDMVSGTIKDIAFDTSGRLWIASEYLTWYDPITLEYKVFDGADYFTSSFVNCIAVDDQGAVWAGTDDKGLYLIQEASAMTVTCLLEKPLSCEGNVDDAQLVVKVNGGHPPYRYIWDKGFSGSEPEGLAAGTYTVTVTDSKGKFEVGRGLVPNPRMSLTIDKISAATHGGNNDGVAEVLVEGGVPDYSFSWDNGETTARASKLAAGDHSVLVVDDNGCRSNAQVTIDESVGELVVSLQQTAKSNCAGEQGNEIEAIIEGGVRPYQSSWSNPSLRGSKLSDLAPGFYGITVTDQKGTQTSASLTIPEPNTFEVVTRVLQSATTNQSDGQAIARLRGGHAPYTYEWSNGATTKSVDNLPAGVHSVVVTDSLGCQASASIELTEDIQALVVEVLSQQDNVCFAEEKGTIALDISGGKPPYNIVWNQSQLTGESLQGLAAGAYAVTVTDQAGLSQSARVDIVQPDEFRGELEIETGATKDSTNGSASVRILSGGIPPLTYAWDNGESDRIAKALSSGTHSVTVTDGNGCSFVLTGDLDELVSPLSIVHTIEESIHCHGESTGIVSVEGRGGRAPYSYTWSDSTKEGNRLTNLAAGYYKVTVTDSDNNTNETEFLMQEPLAHTIEVNLINPAKMGANDGAAIVKFPDSTGNYTILWDNGSTNATTENLSKGLHTVTITDARGCTTLHEIEVTEDIPALQASVQVTNTLNCFGDDYAAVEISASGGAGNYRYSLNDEIVQARVINGLTAGEYKIGVRDGADQEFSTTVVIGEPAQLTAQIEILEPATVGEENGTARVNVEGGRGPYEYSWSNGFDRQMGSKFAAGSYEVVVVDALGCSTTTQGEMSESILPLRLDLVLVDENRCSDGAEASISATIKGGKGPYRYQWNSGATTSSLENLNAGQYIVTIQDALGSSISDTLEVPSWESLSIDVSTTIASPDARDGSAEAIIQGGFAPYSYKWSNGEVRPKASGLAAGKHTIEVRDARGCRETVEFTIDAAASALVASVQLRSPISCPGEKGSLTLDIKGGREPYSISWSNGSQDRELGEIEAGEYAVTITDAEGNTAADRLSLSEPAPIELRVDQVQPASTNGSDGQATVRATGGSGTLNFSWSNGTSGAAASDLDPGRYQVTATDANGCQAIGEIEILEDIQTLVVELEVSQIQCAGENDGAASITVSGGKGPYTIEWSNQNTSASVNNLAPGDHHVSVTDAMGTSRSLQATLIAPAPLDLSFANVQAASTNQEDGIIETYVRGGVAPYTYVWNTGVEDSNLTNVGPGSYQLTVTDANGCSVSGSVDLSENILALQAELTTTAITCADAADGSVQLNLSGGKPPYAIQWSTGSEAEQISNLAAGEYVVTITDAAQNEVTKHAEVQEVAQLLLDVQQKNPASTGSSDGSALAVIKGGTAPYTYEWSNGSNNATADAMLPGEYSITVTDSRGCLASQSITIDEDIQPLSVQVVLDHDIKCHGDSSAAAHVEISGGKGPFTVTWNQEGLFGDDVADLKAGVFEAKVVDQSGQESTAALTIDQPDLLQVTLIDLRPSTDRSSSDGKAKVNISGGTPPYAVLWDDGNTEQEANTLPVGVHVVTVTDAVGCMVEATFETKEKILPDLTAGKLRSGQVVKMEKLLFDTDATTLDSSSQPVLVELFEFLSDNPEIVVQVEGHTNDNPTHTWADSVSTERARVVAQDLVDRGISGKRVFYKGFGKRKPLYSNATAEGRRKNQRVEIRILRLREGD